jgi:hypothetical protein
VKPFRLVFSGGTALSRAHRLIRLPQQSAESNEQQSTKRGGKRPSAGRKKNPVTILLLGTSRTTLLQALENVDPQLVAAKITKLLQSKREIIWLQTRNFIYDRMLGKPKQDVSVSGAFIHAEVRDPVLWDGRKRR